MVREGVTATWEGDLLIAIMKWKRGIGWEVGKKIKSLVF